MRKLIGILAVAAMIASCHSKGQKQPEIIAEGESDSLYMINDSTIGDLQTFYYEGLLPMEGSGVDGNYQLTIQSIGMNEDGTYTVTTTYMGGDGQQQTMNDQGEKIVLIGIPNDSTAVIYELISSSGQPQLNLRTEGDSVLHKVDKDFKKVSQDVKHKLHRKEKSKSKKSK